MRNLRFIVALVATFINRFKVVLFIAFIGGVILFLIGKLLLPRLVPTNIAYVGVVGRFRVDELPESVLKQIGDGLTRIDDTGTPQPNLASSWEFQENGKVWIFHINTNRTWHDGKPVTSDSIQYSFEDVVVERPDEKTIIFKLQNPYAPFPLVVARPTFSKGLVGTGSWRVSNLSIVNSYVEKLEMQSVQNPEVRKIVRFYPSEDAAKAGYKLGQVDRLEDILDPTPFNQWNTANVTATVLNTRYVAVFLNTRSDIFKDNKPLRQALSYAIDKSPWNGVSRVLGPIPPQSWAYNAQIKPYDYDPARANELLKTVLSKDQTLAIKLTTNPTLLPVAEQIAKQWKAVGIETVVQAANSLPDDYDAYLSQYEVSLDPDQYLTWHSTQENTNVTHYGNQRIDKLLEDGRLEMDQEKRKRMYLDFQRFLLEDAPAIFLFHPTSYTIVRK